MYRELSHNINMCLCFSRRKKPRASPSITPPLDSTLHPPYAPRPIYISPSPAAALPKTFTTTVTPAAALPKTFTTTVTPAPALPKTLTTTVTPVAALPKTFTTTVTRHYYQPTFPLSPKPSCRHCHCTPQYRSTVGFTNGNGNGGRHYYVCTECKTNPKLTSSRNSKGWITWDDDKGVEPGNPLCDCGFISRQDRTGVNSSAPGRDFWTCSTGACGYFSWRED